MRKLISRWSYWLGIACLAITVVWWAGSAVGLGKQLAIGPQGQLVSYLSFFHASIAFFVTTIATT